MRYKNPLRRGIIIAVSAALALSPVFAIPAIAEDAAPSSQVAATANTAATTQSDLDNAAAGSKVTLHGVITTDLTVNKKLIITADSDAVMKGSLNISTNDVTVRGVHFVLDGTTQAHQSIQCNGKTGLTVTDSVFELTNGADALNAQMNCVWLGYGANDATFTDNTFAIDRPGVDNSYVAINIVGATVKNTAITGNKATFLQNATPVASAHFVIANGNKSTSGEYGLSGLTITKNTVTNDSGAAAKDSGTYGIGVSNVEDATISGNTFSKLYMGIKPSMWPNEAPSKSIAITDNTFDGSYVGILMREADVEPGAVKATDNDFTKTDIPYAGLNGSLALVWQADDGALYPSAAEAVKAGKTTITLVRDSVKETVVIPEGSNVTIDLAGHSLNLADDAEYGITNNGTLTVKDSSANNAGTVQTGTKGVFGGTGKTSITGGTYTDQMVANVTADGYAVLVKTTEDDAFQYVVNPTKDVKKQAQYRVVSDNATYYFATRDEADAFAENMAGGDVRPDVQQVWFTVSFDTKGNGTVDSIKVENGTSAKLPAVPAREGYTGAWYDGDTKVDADDFTPTADVTLTARYTKSTTTKPGAGNGGATDSNTNGNTSDDGGKTLSKTGSSVLPVLAATMLIAFAGLGLSLFTAKRRADR